MSNALVSQSHALTRSAITQGRLGTVLLVCMASAAWYAFFTYFEYPEFNWWKMLVPLLGFTAFVLYVVSIVLRPGTSSIELSAEGIRQRGGRVLSWEAITAVRFWPGFQRLVLFGQGGERVNVELELERFDEVLNTIFTRRPASELKGRGSWLLSPTTQAALFPGGMLVSLADDLISLAIYATFALIAVAFAKKAIEGRHDRLSFRDQDFDALSSSAAKTFRYEDVEAVGVQLVKPSIAWLDIRQLRLCIRARGAGGILLNVAPNDLIAAYGELLRRAPHAARTAA